MTHSRRPLRALTALVATTSLTGFALVGASAAHASDHVGVPANVLAKKAPTCAGHRATIVGTNRADKIVGTPHRDVIVGLGGDDVIHGRGGRDIICGGDGWDKLYGGSGRDVLRGELGADKLHGGHGDDRLEGGLDFVGNLEGRTKISDVLVGGPGDDFLDGGRDTRRFKYDDENTYDTISYTGSTRGVRVSLGKATRTVKGRATGQGHDRIVWYPRLRIRGSKHADVLIGSAGKDILEGMAGNDVIRGNRGKDSLDGDPFQAGNGSDRVFGGPGADTISSWGGKDVLDGGSGKDDLSLENKVKTEQPVTMRGGSGNDHLWMYYGDRPKALPGSSVSGGAGRDTFSLTANGAARWIINTSTRSISAKVGKTTPTGVIAGLERFKIEWGVVRFTGSAVSEYLETDTKLWARMGGGNDTVLASASADYVDGGPGEDTVKGYAGDDNCPNVEHRTSCHA